MPGEPVPRDRVNLEGSFASSFGRLGGAAWGRMTVQLQSPFPTPAKAFGSPILAELVAAGQEIALHFHEDAHLGQDPER